MRRSLFLVPLFVLVGCATSGPSQTASQPVVPPPAPVAQAPVEAPKPAVPQAPTAQPAATALVSVSSGGYLVGPNGMTLYVFAKDQANDSYCTDVCAKNWPALQPQGSTVSGQGTSGTFSTFTRDDGTTQVAYNTKPLYYWVNDKKPGDTTGDGVLGAWSTAKP